MIANIGMLSQLPDPSLLPMGFVDLLPAEAEAEAKAIARIMEIFGRYGYQRVRPPLLEFESSLLSGAGEDLAGQSFRMLDPSSHKMMALRPDMTTQIARIAEKRLRDRPRPLRLSYAGDCVVIGTPGREGNRQIPQAGIELIGPDCPAADAEIIALGAEALADLGIEGVSFDLSMPVLIWGLIDQLFGAEESGICQNQEDADKETGNRRCALIHALDRRDSAAVSVLGGELAPLFLGMMAASGPVQEALQALDSLHFPEEFAHYVQRLREDVIAISQYSPDISLTLDPVDFRGWHYHTGLCVTVFARQSREELGRGGRYLAAQEPACGLTLHPQAILRVAPPWQGPPRCLVPDGLDKAELTCLHQQGYATIAPLETCPLDRGKNHIDDVEETRPEEKWKQVARRLECSHFWHEGRVVAL